MATKTLAKIRQNVVEQALNDEDVTNEDLVYSVLLKGTEAIALSQAQFIKVRESGRTITPDVKVMQKSFSDVVACVCLISHVLDADLPSHDEVQEFVYDNLELTVVNDGILACLALSRAFSSLISDFYLTQAGDRDFDEEYVYERIVEILAMASVVADLGDFDIGELLEED